MNNKEKNLLDLKHSLYTTKASLFFSIGVGGAIALFFGIQQLVDEVLLSLLVGNVWLIVFVWVSIIHFSRCSNIQRELEKYLERNKKMKGRQK